MKKTFDLTHEKIKYLRRIDAVKNEIRKYIKRERRKKLPDGVDFWDFDCRFGDTEADAKVIHLTEIDKCINDIQARERFSFYIEIVATEGVRTKPEAEIVEAAPEVIEAPKPVLPRIKTFGDLSRND